ncbi:hypothetical protein Taro_028782 [Colocasia esculenta]|uniref:Uncharacterized protein n=1 Tax=Colocasia esculenta TaxID=4460 RepID=A0A843VRC9_COLES|nr:hypothetical protein [Colocasia esculenta]
MPHSRELGPESLKVPGMGLRVERQLDLSSVAARLRGSFPTEPMTREAHPYLLPGSFPTEPVTREAYPYLLPGEGDQEISRPSSSGGSAPPAV